jgi:hypothetical protein
MKGLRRNDDAMKTDAGIIKKVKIKNRKAKNKRCKRFYFLLLTFYSAFTTFATHFTFIKLNKKTGK